MGLAYWDLAGKIAGKPLYRYLRDVFELDTPVVSKIPIAAYTWCRFPDVNGEHEVTFGTYPRHVKSLMEDETFPDHQAVHVAISSPIGISNSSTTSATRWASTWTSASIPTRRGARARPCGSCRGWRTAGSSG